MNWRTVLISAAVAAVTTLLIEYLAKPRLEARKERIVKRQRLRRQLKADLTRAPAESMGLCYLQHLLSFRLGIEALGQFEQRMIKLDQKYRYEIDNLPSYQEVIISSALLNVRVWLPFLKEYTQRVEATMTKRTLSEWDELAFGYWFAFFHDQLMWDLARAASALHLRRWKVWSYREQVRSYSRKGYDDTQGPFVRLNIERLNRLKQHEKASQ